MQTTATAQFIVRAMSFFICFLFAAGVSAGSNEVLGEVKLKAAGKVEKTAGIWVDGLYLGFLKELKGSKKILLLPGEHEITARLSGHRDFETQFEVVAGETNVVRVAMREKLGAIHPDKEDMAKVKILVKPTRAAVFVNDRFIGHVDQFRGVGKSLGLPAGVYKIAIELPGFQSFQTEITLQKRQDYEIKTKLRRGEPDENRRLTRVEKVAAKTEAEAAVTTNKLAETR